MTCTLARISKQIGFRFHIILFICATVFISFNFILFIYGHTLNKGFSSIYREIKYLIK